MKSGSRGTPPRPRRRAVAESTSLNPRLQGRDPDTRVSCRRHDAEGSRRDQMDTDRLRSRGRGDTLLGRKVRGSSLEGVSPTLIYDPRRLVSPEERCVVSTLHRCLSDGSRLDPRGSRVALWSHLWVPDERTPSTPVQGSEYRSGVSPSRTPVRTLHRRLVLLRLLPVRVAPGETCDTSTTRLLCRGKFRSDGGVSVP